MPTGYAVIDGYVIGIATNDEHADLASADLTNEFLTGVDLTDADLAHADLHGVGIDFATFAHADLAGANLADVTASSVTFTDANMSEANLTGASLDQSNLTGADLSGASTADGYWLDVTCPDGTVTQVPCTTAAPTTAGEPTIKAPGGHPRVDEAATCSAPAFVPSGTVHYVWIVNGHRVPAATSRNFTPTATEVDRSLRCEVSAANSNGTGAAVVSAPLTIEAGVALRTTRSPSISGSHRVGALLTCAHGAWTPAATSYHYQWLLSGHRIAGATRATYRAGRADLGSRLRCQVTADEPDIPAECPIHRHIASPSSPTPCGRAVQRPRPSRRSR